LKKSIKHPKIKVESYGRYTKWNCEKRDLPKILEFTNTIQAEEGNEFGIILHVTRGKGINLNYCIKHPPFKDANGTIEPDFTGTYLINTNDYKFYIGDCIWQPIEDKPGDWIIQIEYQGEIIAEHLFKVIL
jgi:hypothetical protein